MEYLKIPETPVLCGEEAIAALQEYIGGLEEGRNKELTQEQTEAMVKLANGLISSIEAELSTNVDAGAPTFLVQLTATIGKGLRHLGRNPPSERGGEDLASIIIANPPMELQRSIR